MKITQTELIDSVLSKGELFDINTRDRIAFKEVA